MDMYRLLRAVHDGQSGPGTGVVSEEFLVKSRGGLSAKYGTAGFDLTMNDTLWAGQGSPERPKVRQLDRATTIYVKADTSRDRVRICAAETVLECPDVS